MPRDHDDYLTRAAEYADKLSGVFEDVHVDGTTGEVTARRHKGKGYMDGFNMPHPEGLSMMPRENYPKGAGLNPR